MSIQQHRVTLPNRDAKAKGFVVHRSAFGTVTPKFQEVAVKRQFKFSKKLIDALPPCPAEAGSKEVEYSDQEISGLRLQVNRLGRKFFLFRYQIGSRKRSMKVGPYPDVSIDDARQKVIEWRALLIKGIDPQEQREAERQASMTFSVFYQEYLLPHIQATKRSAKSDVSRIANHILPAFGNREMASITPLELQRFHNEKRTSLSPATSNRIFEIIRRSYNLAIYWRLLPESANAARGIKLHRENNRRERYLSQEELQRLMPAFDAAPNQTMIDAFRLLLATGCRKNEILHLRHDQLRLDRREIYLPSPKGGKGRHVVLNDVALEILQRRQPIPGNPHVFPGKVAGQPINNPSKAWRAVLKVAGIDPQTTTLHTLRHSHASFLTEVASLHEIAGILGHASSTTTQRYAHLSDQRLRQCSSHVADLMRQAQRGGAS
jgi:integrase